MADRFTGYFSSLYQKYSSKRNWIIAGVLFFVLIDFLLIRWIFSLSDDEPEPEIVKIISPENREILKTMRPELGYEMVVDEYAYENLNMIGYVDKIGVRAKTTRQRLYGMILRSLRFQNISRRVEKKYGLPKNLILAMVMQESGGADLLPNSGDDGGFGLCHMQGYTASQFGLKTYDNCNKLVCKKHGKMLRRLITENNYDRRVLIQLDDRLHPILNLDAAGRMLAYAAMGKQYKKTRLKTAIYVYAGKYNYAKYYKNVMHYRKILNDTSIIASVRKEFNRINPNLKINGQKAGFNEYIQTHQNINRNYGLDNY